MKLSTAIVCAAALAGCIKTSPIQKKSGPTWQEIHQQLLKNSKTLHRNENIKPEEICQFVDEAQDMTLAAIENTEWSAEPEPQTDKKADGFFHPNPEVSATPLIKSETGETIQCILDTHDGIAMACAIKNADETNPGTTIEVTDKKTPFIKMTLDTPEGSITTIHARPTLIDNKPPADPDMTTELIGTSQTEKLIGANCKDEGQKKLDGKALRLFQFIWKLLGR